MDAKIKSIKIALGDTEADLTIDEARSLKQGLDEIFPEQTDRIVPIPMPYPVPVPDDIYWPRRPRYYWTSGDSAVPIPHDHHFGVTRLSVY